MGIAQLSASWTREFHRQVGQADHAILWGDSGTCSSAARKMKKARANTCIHSIRVVVRSTLPGREGQWGYRKGSMECQWALVRVNGGIEKGQRNVNGRSSGSMGVLNNGGSMGALKKNNEEGIGQRQWKY